MLLLVMAVVAPAAGALVEVISQDSIEVQFAEALLVVRGRVGPLTSSSSLNDGVVQVEVIEVLKGPAVVGGTVPVDLIDLAVLSATVPLHETREGLFLLWRSDRHDVNGEPYYSPLKGRPVGLFLFEGGRVSAWDQSGSRSDYAAHRMDGRALTREAALMAAAREAAKVLHWEKSVTLVAADFPRTSPLRSVAAGRLRVPGDERLERLAVAWLDEADVRYRVRAAEVLAYFRSEASVRRLRALAWDPGYELGNAPEWEAAREGRVVRTYPARAAAARALRDWGVRQEPVTVEAPHDVYRPVAWWAVGVLVMGIVLIAATGGRRGGILRRVLVGCAVVAAVWVVGLRSRAGAEAIGWAVGGASHEVVSSQGEVWLLRVADGAGTAGVAVRSELVDDAPGFPWFLRMLDEKHGVAWRGFGASRGVVEGAGYTYQMARLPHVAIVGLLMVVPAWGALTRAARTLRRRRRARRGWCVGCGYDLRGTAGGARCPECGSGGRVVRRGLVVVMAVVSGVLVAGAGRAGAQPEPEPEGDYPWKRPSEVEWRLPRRLVEIERFEISREAGWDSVPEMSFPGWPHPAARAANDDWMIVANPWSAESKAESQPVIMGGWLRRPLTLEELVTLPVQSWATDLERTPPDPPWVFRDVEMPPIERPVARGQRVDYDLLSDPDLPSDPYLPPATTEAEALTWLTSDNAFRRAMGVRGLRPYPSDANERRLRAMLSDPGFLVQRADVWEARPDWRAYRNYIVRLTAAQTLWEWKGLSQRARAEPPFLEPDSIGRRPPWGRWVTVACGVAGVVALSGRRGRVRVGRLLVGGSFAAVCVMSVLLWRSDVVCDTFDASGGTWSYQVASARGAVWLIRVRDGSPARGVGWRDEALGTGERPWFGRAVPFDPSWTWTWREGVRWDSGWIQGPFARVNCQIVRVPYVLLMGALTLIPAGAIVVRARRSLRRRRRVRADRCVACGYDLRGSARSGRCPECGAGKGCVTTRPRPTVV